MLTADTPEQLVQFCKDKSKIRDAAAKLFYNNDFKTFKNKILQDIESIIYSRYNEIREK